MDIRSFFISLSKLCSPQSLAWIFIVSLAIILIGYIILLVVDKNKCNKKAYRIYYLFLIGLTATQTFIFLCASSQTISIRNIIAVLVIEFLFALFLRTVYSLSLRLIRIIKGKRRVYKRTTIDLRSFIPEKDLLDRSFNEDIRATVVEPPPTNVKEAFANSFAQPIEQEQSIRVRQNKTENDADYSHVKNIIERLSFYELNAQEKKLVGDLNLSVNRAENGEDSYQLKEKISDGLGGLLKIMAKYNL